MRLTVLAGVSLVLALAATPRLAQAADTRTVSGPLATGFPGRSTIPHLSQRLAALAATPAGSRAAQAGVAGTPLSGPGSLQRQPGTGRLVVDIRVARLDAGVVSRLRAAGAVIMYRDVALRTISAAVAPSALRAIARVTGVQYVGEVVAPLASEVCDSTVSAGDGILKAVQERANAGVDGTGVTVGILSDSFDKRVSATTHAADDVTSDNLPGTTNTCGHPTPVGVLQDFSAGGQEDEGRAMAQIVHDLAPGANILFATAEDTPEKFAANIRALADEGADIIVDDVNYFNEPVYQDGIIAKAVDDVRAAGVAYFSSAGNNNITVGGHDIGSYEAVGGYRATPCPAAITAHNANYTDCHNFNAGGTDSTLGLSTAAGKSMVITLDWAEPQFGVQTDYALCLLQTNGTFGFCADDRNPGVAGSQQAVEIADVNTGSAGFQVVVARYSGNVPNNNATPRFKLTFQTNGGGAVTSAEYTTPTGTDVLGPTTYGHNAAPGAITVAAADVRVMPSTVNGYSSHGPVTLLYGPVDGTTPAAALDSPQVLAKPDITASDCALNTFFPSVDVDGHFHFCGTSAAAPHAAAVAALLLQQRPSLTPSQVSTALTSTAVDLSLPPATQGAGLVDAAAAGAAVRKTQRLTFKQPAPGAVGGNRTLTASTTSGLPVTFKVNLSTAPHRACKVSGSHGATLHYLKAGICVIDAKQLGNGIYQPATGIERRIVVAPAPAVTTKSLPSGVVGKKYAAQLHGTGGNTPRTWAVKSGKLPPGLKLSKSGAIAGRPTKAGKYDVTVSVTDSSVPNVRATKSFTIKIKS